MNYFKLIETLSRESNKTIAPLGGSAGMLLFMQLVKSADVDNIEEQLEGYDHECEVYKNNHCCPVNPKTSYFIH